MIQKLLYSPTPLMLKSIPTIIPFSSFSGFFPISCNTTQSTQDSYLSYNMIVLQISGKTFKNIWIILSNQGLYSPSTSPLNGYSSGIIWLHFSSNSGLILIHLMNSLNTQTCFIPFESHVFTQYQYFSTSYDLFHTRATPKLPRFKGTISMLLCIGHFGFTA